MDRLRNRPKSAEVLGLVGACIAAAGLALFLAPWLDPFKLGLLVVGLAVHAAAMFHRQRLERAAGTSLTRWERALYWTCWLLLAGLAAYVVLVGPAANRS